ncbi:transporter substrate-binding domain-containing protein [Microbaculum marinum]|uniref:Transporter substrate-binding domain-containing protein n=1 Tax=Microbaculum marinum TaxID=1764581 RepID=A0AAW9RQB5_9HYPH
MNTTFATKSLLFTLALLAPQLAQADPVWDRIESSGEIVCGAIPNDKIGSWTDPDSGEWLGYEIELCKNIAAGLSETMGKEIKPTYRETSWKTIVLDLQSEKIDLWPGMSATEQRKQALSMIGPIYNLAFCGVERRGYEAGDTWDALNDPDVRIATVTGTSIEDLFKKMAPEATHLSLSEYAEVILATQSGRADVMGADILRCLTVVNTAPDAFGDIVIPKPMHAAGSSAGVIKSADKLTAWLEDWAKQAKESGKVTEIFLTTFEAAGLDADKLPDDIEF